MLRILAMTRAWLADVMCSPSSICKPLTIPINLCLTNVSLKNAVHVVHVILLKRSSHRVGVLLLKG